MASSVVEPYNAVLSGHFNMEHSSVSFMFDNQSLFEICKKNLGVERPSYLVNRKAQEPKNLHYYFNFFVLSNSPPNPRI